MNSDIYENDKEAILGESIVFLCVTCNKFVKEVDENGNCFDCH